MNLTESPSERFSSSVTTLPLRMGTYSSRIKCICVIRSLTVFPASSTFWSLSFISTLIFIKGKEVVIKNSYSYLRASTGSRLAAHRAGTKPAIIPTTKADPAETRKSAGVISGFRSIKPEAVAA